MIQRSHVKTTKLVFRTSDGKEFNEEWKAEQHQAVIDSNGTKRICTSCNGTRYVDAADRFMCSMGGQVSCPDCLNGIQTLRWCK